MRALITPQSHAEKPKMTSYYNFQCSDVANVAAPIARCAGITGLSGPTMTRFFNVYTSYNSMLYTIDMATHIQYRETYDRVYYYIHGPHLLQHQWPFQRSHESHVGHNLIKCERVPLWLNKEERRRAYIFISIGKISFVDTSEAKHL